MTLPRERTVAILNTKEFLYALMSPKKTPKVPLAIRNTARWLLKHFPGNYDLRQIVEALPDVLGSTERLERSSNTPFSTEYSGDWIFNKQKPKAKRRKK